MKPISTKTLKMLLDCPQGACIAADKHEVIVRLHQDLDTFMALNGIRCKFYTIVPSAENPGWSCLQIAKISVAGYRRLEAFCSGYRSGALAERYGVA